MKGTKIDWCDCTVNPIVGCPNGCAYCYARKINDRFRFIEKWNEPKFFPERLEQFVIKAPKTVFIDSMSDAGCWEQEWFNQVMDATQRYPQHKYIVLTKRPYELMVKRNNYIMANGNLLKNVHLGISITCQMDILNSPFLEYFDFLSIEPLLAKINFPDWLKGKAVKTIIIGAETGNRKGKVVPQKQWIDDIVAKADEFGMKVFMKESLRDIVDENKFRQDKDIWKEKKLATKIGA